MKYLLYLDYTVEGKERLKRFNGYDYFPLNGKTLEEAIEEADEKWNELNNWMDNTRNIYLMRIMAKSGNIVTPHLAGYKYEPYTAILCKRSCGWHRNIKQNSEEKHVVNKCWETRNKDSVWYELDTSDWF